jgi:CheY-like chemotaxis protein
MTTPASSRMLLVVEDSDEDYETMLRTLKRIGAAAMIARCVDGDDALDRLFQRGLYSAPATLPMPSLILLDLNLPATDGREVLEMIKRDETLKSIPVVILTTSSNPKDIEECYRNGANSYLLKPVNLQQFTHQLKLMYDYWFDAVLLPESLG